MKQTFKLRKQNIEQRLKTLGEKFLEHEKLDHNEKKFIYYTIESISNMLSKSDKDFDVLINQAENSIPLRISRIDANQVGSEETSKNIL